MQFYIIHEDPAENARLLPDYCLKQVNVREGYQILSDIGHIYGVTWDGQNKCYSKSHPTTRYHGRSQEAFKSFLDYYEACLNAYGKTTSFHSKYYAFFTSGAFRRLNDKLPSCSMSEQATVYYLLKEKRDKLTANEVARLEGMI